jgi:hypothetical protein
VKTRPVSASKNVPLIETYVTRTRKWTIPEGDCIAYPSPVFYENRVVAFSNEGNNFYPRWVALDRYNREPGKDRTYQADELAILYDRLIGSPELAAASFEPEIALPPPPPGAPFMKRLVYFLSRLVD